MGSYFYISTHNGSTDVVTNSVGEVVARYAYEPFGRVVKELSDMDADGDGIAYAGTFQFTGQEYEQETGLHNYKARLYDPDTGRFLQPDPVHTAQPGQDNWDRYAYVWNNPVNFTDPTGKTPGHAGPSAKTLELAILFSFIGSSSIDTDAITVGLLYLILNDDTNVNEPMGPGHNYSGSGNYDRYDSFNSDKKKLQTVANILLWFSLFGAKDDASKAKMMVVMFYLAARLSPAEGTPGDRAGIVHDRAVPSSNGDLFNAPPSTDRKHMRASEDWFKTSWHNLMHPNAIGDRYAMAYADSAWVEEIGLGRTGRSIVAGFNFLYSYASDITVYLIGSGLFGLDYMVRGFRNMGRRFSNWFNDRMHIKGGLRAIWS